MKKATINDKAIGTWLEPYIGYEVVVIKSRNKILYFKWEHDDETHHHNIDYFDIINSQKKKSKGFKTT